MQAVLFVRATVVPSFDNVLGATDGFCELSGLEFNNRGLQGASAPAAAGFSSGRIQLRTDSADVGLGGRQHV